MDQQAHIGSRLKDWIKDKGLTAIAFSEKVGIQRSALSHLFSGRNNPSVEVLLKMKSTYPDLNLEWLITGQFPEKIRSVTEVQDANSQDSSVRKFTDVNILSDVAEFQDDIANIKPNNKIKKDNPKLIRIIELYSDNSFKSYDA